MSQARGELQSSPEFLTPSATPPIANIAASTARVAALAAAGTPAAKGAFLIDPDTKKIYGQSDGLGGAAPLGAMSTAPVSTSSLRSTPAAKGSLLIDPNTGLIYGQSNGVGGYTALGGEAQQRLAARRIVNATGSSASYVVAQRGSRKFGGYLVVSGTFTITIRHGVVVGGDILSYAVSPTDDKRAAPSDITDGLYVTLSANGEVVLFFSDDKDNSGAPFGAASGPVLVPMAATGRFWLGRGTLRGFTMTGQTAAGSGIKLYDGWDNTGALIHLNAAPTIGRMGGAAEFLYPIELRSGGYVELLGTAQTITLDMGEAQ